MAVAIVGQGDAERIISAGLDHSVVIWDAAGKPVRRFGPPPPEQPFAATGHEGSAAILPDGTMVAIGATDGGVTVLSTVDGSQLASFRGHEGIVHGMRFSADGRHLLTGSADKTVRLWSTDDWRHVRAFEGHANGVSSVAISEDGSRVLSASWDKTVRLWDVASGSLLRVFTGHEREARALAFSPDGMLALSAGADATIRAWSLRPERQIRTLAPPLETLPHVNGVAVSPDGRMIVCASEDGTLRLWDTPAGLLLRTIAAHEGAARSAAFTKDGQRLISTGEEDGLIKVWPVLSQEGDEPLRVMRSPEPKLRSLSIAPDGRTAVTAGLRSVAGEPDTGIARVWDLESGEMLRSYEAGAGEIYDLDHSPDGSMVVTAFEDSSVDLWDPQTGRLIHRLSKEGGFQDIYATAFDPTGKLICGGGWGGVPRSWPAMAPYEPQGPLEGRGHGSTMMSAVFSADGEYLVTGGWDNTVQVWDVQRRSMIRALASHGRPVVSVASGSDGRLVISGSWDGTVKLWDFSAVTDFEDQRSAVAGAMKTLSSRPDDGAALHVLGNWYARRGADALAVRTLAEAAKRGERVSHLLLARCYTTLESWDEARRAYERARTMSEAPAEYIDLCLRALPGAD
jgi:WD40 repeat protein